MEAEVETSIIELPMTEPSPMAYRARHLEVQLDSAQANTLKKILAGLSTAGNRLKNGRWVQTNPDAIRWILEKAAD